MRPSRHPFRPARPAVAGWTLAMLLLALAACSQQRSAPASQESSAAADAAGAAPEVELPEANLQARPRSAPAPAAPTAAEPVPPPDAATQLSSAVATQDDGPRRFIRTANARFRVGDVYRSALAIEDLTARHGGFVVSNDIEAHVNDVRTRPIGDGRLVELATYTVAGDLQVRVPSAKAQGFLREMATHVEFLDSRSFQAQDAQFELLRQQLAWAREQAAQQTLGQLAQDEGRVRDRTQAVQARSSAQLQRDEALLQQRTLEDRIAFATLDLALYQQPQVRRSERVDVAAIIEREGPPFFVRLWDSIKGGWYGLLDTLVVLALLWPLWLVIAAAVFAVRLLRRRRRPAA